MSFAQRLGDPPQLRYGEVEGCGALGYTLNVPSSYNPGTRYNPERFTTLFFYHPVIKDWVSVESYPCGVHRIDGTPSGTSEAMTLIGNNLGNIRLSVPGAGYIYAAKLDYTAVPGANPSPQNTRCVVSFYDTDTQAGSVIKAVYREFNLPDVNPPTPPSFYSHQHKVVLHPFSPAIRVYHYDNFDAAIAAIDPLEPYYPPDDPELRLYFRFRMNPVSEPEMGMNP